MQFSPDQEKAFSAIEAGNNVFLSGGGGTGKSTVIREFQKKYPEKNIAMLATTGTAASLIGGQTAHSFFKLPSRPIAPGDCGWTNLDLIQRLRSFDVIFIDEISMAGVGMLQGIRDVLQSAAKGYGDFGGYQVVVSGDFYQASPVVTEQDAGILEQIYGKDQIFAFQNRYFKDFQTCELSVNHRQANGPYAEWLSKIRNGQTSDFSIVNDRVSDAFDDATYLVSTRKEAEARNHQMSERLAPGFYRVQGRVSGSFDRDYAPVSPEFTIKPLSRVVICANNFEAGYANGSTGTLIRCEKRKEDGLARAIVRLDDGREVVVEPHTWEQERYEFSDDKGFRAVKIGEFSQLPLLPGWALTIHRSQGMTLDKVHIGTHQFFCPGQAYVALSRVRTLEGLTLSAPMSIEDMHYDPRVFEFMGHKMPEADVELVADVEEFTL